MSSKSWLIFFYFPCVMCLNILINIYAILFSLIIILLISSSSILGVFMRAWTALADFGNRLKPDKLNSGFDTIESSILIKKKFVLLKYKF